MAFHRRLRALSHLVAFAGGGAIAVGALAMVRAPTGTQAQAEPPMRPTPMDQLVGNDVVISLVGGQAFLEGTLVSIDEQWVQTDDVDGGPRVIPTRNVAIVEVPRGDVRRVRQAADDAEKAAAEQAEAAPSDEDR